MLLIRVSVIFHRQWIWSSSDAWPGGPRPGVVLAEVRRVREILAPAGCPDATFCGVGREVRRGVLRKSPLPQDRFARPPGFQLEIPPITNGSFP